MKFEIEFDDNVVPKQYNPVEFRTPKIGETILIFMNNKPIIIRNNGNICFGPCLILKKV